MADLNICSIGNGSCGEYISFTSKASLDEYEIINIFPRYEGKVNYTHYEHNEYNAIENKTEYWKQQFSGIKNKLIVVTLRQMETYTYISSLRNKYYSYNYKFLPFLEYENIDNQVGKIVVLGQCSTAIKMLYDWFMSQGGFNFKLYINDDYYKPLFFTKDKNHKLGGIYNDTKNNNVYLLLPDYDIGIFRKIDNQNKYKLLLGNIYNEFFGKPKTEQPEWVKNNSNYLSNIEENEQNKISENQQKIAEAEQDIAMSMQIIEEEQKLKSLLYGQSHELEEGILEAMKLFGFMNPHTYNSDNCEIDVICDEKNNPGILLIGEAEGASKGTVNSKKINQLCTHEATYIEENGVAEEVTTSKVLFGNAFANIPPEQREEYFGQHVYKIAKLQKIKLVRTPDLFTAALYIKNSGDKEYARQCYELFFDEKYGVIEFPAK